MPFIHTRTNCPITPEQEEKLTAALGSAISLLPGKSEQWLMLQFEDRCRMHFRGKGDEKIAYVNVKVYGGADAGSYDRLTGKITALLREHLAIAPDHVYVSYDETEHWGWMGENF